jgi:hypothetical protein
MEHVEVRVFSIVMYIHKNNNSFNKPTTHSRLYLDDSKTQVLQLKLKREVLATKS